jgi:hypothetical protein
VAELRIKHGSDSDLDSRIGSKRVGVENKFSYSQVGDGVQHYC